MSAIFPARYPGRCLCGASFVVGARIAWDAQTRRATLCPGCAAPKAKRGEWHALPSGIHVRFDRHPTTTAIVLMVATSIESMAMEVFYLKDGKWGFAHCGGGRGEILFANPVSHETIEGWRVRFEEPMSRALAA